MQGNPKGIRHREPSCSTQDILRHLQTNGDDFLGWISLFYKFIDACSHHLVVKLLKMKDEALALMKAYFERAEAETGKRTNIFRSDGGGDRRMHKHFPKRWWWRIWLKRIPTISRVKGDPS